MPPGSAVHREIDQYEDENVGVQALSEGEKAAGNVRDISKSRYARKLKKKAKMQGKKGTKTAKSSAQEPTAAQDAGSASGPCEGGSNWLSRWRQKQDIQTELLCRRPVGAQRRRPQAVKRHPMAAMLQSPAWSRSSTKEDRWSAPQSTALHDRRKEQRARSFDRGRFSLLLLHGHVRFFLLFHPLFWHHAGIRADHVLCRGPGYSWCRTGLQEVGKGTGQKIKRIPTDHPGYNEYQYHLDPIEHDPWQLTSFLTTLYDDYTRSEVQGKLKETFKKQYKLTTWVEVQIRYKTVWVISPAGIPIPTQVPYEYRIFHTKLVNRGLEVVIREELDNDQWKRYEIFQDTLGGRPYLFNGGLPPGGSDGSGAPGIDYQVPAEALTDSEFAAIYKEAQKYVGTPYVWGGSPPGNRLRLQRLRLLGLQPERLQCRAHHGQRSLE